MQERDQNTNKNEPLSDLANKGRGMQGIDKAPGEEPAESTENVVWETQKGKNKVDGDPSKESDQPISQE